MQLSLALLSLVAVAACGRLAFAPQPDAAPDARELGPCPADVALGEVVPPTVAPAIAATPDGYVALYVASAGTTLARISADHQVIDQQVIGPAAAAGTTTSIAASGSEVAAAWVESGVEVVVVGPEGSELARPLITTNPDVASPVVTALPDGSSFVAAWLETLANPRDLFWRSFTRAETAGTYTDASSEPHATPDITARGSEYLLAWIEADGLHLRRLAADGVVVTFETVFEPGVLLAPAVVATPTGYGIAWVRTDAGGTRVQLVEIDPQLGRVGPVIDLGSDAGFYIGLDMAWDDGHYVIAATFDSNASTDLGDIVRRFVVAPGGAVVASDSIGMPGASGDSNFGRVTAGSDGVRFVQVEARNGDPAPQAYVICRR